MSRPEGSWQGSSHGGGGEVATTAARIDRYEAVWIAVAALMIVSFLAAVVLGASLHAIHPPSHVETIDPLTVRTDSEFARPGVRVGEEGEVTVVGVAEMFRFLPAVIRVPAGRPVRFRLTSPDVLHGFQVVGSNANVMVVPGYVSDFTVTFPRPGEYLLLCNEYCGLAHHRMQGRVIVEPPAAANGGGR